MTDHATSTVPYDLLMNALCENYESIYDIDLESGAYRVYYESESYRSLHLARSGKDFFADLPAGVDRVVDPEDRAFVLRMLGRQALTKGVTSGKYHSLVYRINRQGTRVYHQLRATLADADGRRFVLMGIRDVDAVFRQNAAREQELATLRRELDQSRVQTSMGQMKPHFLYNALGSIQEVMLEDPERAAGLLEDFTVHLRSCIRAMDADRPVPFEQELANIRAYASIEGMRFGDRLQVRYELTDTAFDVVPLSIQPLVENAIRHGIHQRGRQGGTVTLRAWGERDAWVVEVEDDGAGFDVDAFERAAQDGQDDACGLRNARFRLEQVLGASLQLRSTPGVGTTATVRIPRRPPREGGGA